MEFYTSVRNINCKKTKEKIKDTVESNKIKT